MQKNIILSGGKASGKSWIATAITTPFPDSKVLQTSASEVFSKLKTEDLINLKNQFDVMLIDDCSVTDIIELDLCLPNNMNMNLWTRQICVADSKLTIIYMTKENVDSSKLSDFHVINCNNNY